VEADLSNVNPTAGGIRARLRAELTASILQTARRHVAEHGAAALSLRAVARELQMSSSAVYRYFASRDELLTALIIDAYNAIGEQVEQAADRVAPSNHFGQFEAICHAVRKFATEHPHEYSLVYGSPVPGYEAPPDTVGPAARVPVVLGRLLGSALQAGQLAEPPAEASPIPPSVLSDLEDVRDSTFPEVGADLLARGVLVWVQLFGLVSFELYGHLVGTIDDGDTYFAWSVGEMARSVGLERGGLT
jgi:AcrR family transcriptional regulator